MFVLFFDVYFFVGFMSLLKLNRYMWRIHQFSDVVCHFLILLCVFEIDVVALWLPSHFAWDNFPQKVLKSNSTVTCTHMNTAQWIPIHLYIVLLYGHHFFQCILPFWSQAKCNELYCKAHCPCLPLPLLPLFLSLPLMWLKNAALDHCSVSQSTNDDE